MRINEIQLEWFRGAAGMAALKTQGRSLVVYGPNGSGKSSFVDGLEYSLNDGRIKHLAHEYSGRNQVRAVLNTHRPADRSGKVSIVYMDDSRIDVSIEANGSHTTLRSGASPAAEWDYRRTVLRQDEVSEFIHSTKGEKYSVLLPLLGLAHLEQKAETLRQLSSAILKQCGAREAAALLKSARAALSGISVAPDLDAAEILHTLCLQFGPRPHEHSPEACASVVHQALEERLTDLTELQRAQLALEEFALLSVKPAIDRVRTTATKVATAGSRLAHAHLAVLRASRQYLTQTDESSTLLCPACGSELQRSALHEHIQSQITELSALLQASDEYDGSCAALRDICGRANRLCTGKYVSAWADRHGGSLRTWIAAVAQLETPARVDEERLNWLVDNLVPAVAAAAGAAAFLPPEASDLAHAKERLLGARSLLAAELAISSSRKGEQLSDYVGELEAEARASIREQASRIIEGISEDVQRMWRRLHPGDPIEDVRLRVPDDADKAIDISLKFYGKELESPRLTLSEGYRNSLGLCVFLAMAARDASDNPIVLDDVIVSLDRNHRSLVAGLVQNEFHERQVLILTHDRDWFSDLRQQLAGGQWAFSTLLPFRDPSIGITLSNRSGTFEDARAYVAARPDTAANEARKTMDVQLAIVADKLGLEMPFVRGERNDRRGAHDFLAKLASKGRNSLKRRDEAGAYQALPSAAAALSTADTLLLTWGNRGSHSTDVTTAEAEQLIEACEGALAVFRCDTCGKPLFFAEFDGGTQCQCGTLRWK